MTCKDCGTKLSSGGVCPNCQEELFIMDEQYMQMESSEDMQPLSKEFVAKVNEQREEVKHRKAIGNP